MAAYDTQVLASSAAEAALEHIFEGEN